MRHFSGEKARGDSYWIMDAAAPNDNHYWQAEIVHIISNADSSPRPLSSELFAQAVPALHALPPCLRVSLRLPVSARGRKEKRLAVDNQRKAI